MAIESSERRTIGVEAGNLRHRERHATAPVLSGCAISRLGLQGAQVRRRGRGVSPRGDRLLPSLQRAPGEQVTNRKCIAPYHYWIRMQELHRRNEQESEGVSTKHLNEIRSLSFRRLTRRSNAR